MKLSNLTHPKAAMKDGFPSGAYAYSPFTPMDLDFRKPVSFQSVFLKKHRAAEYYLNDSIGSFEV